MDCLVAFGLLNFQLEMFEAGKRVEVDKLAVSGLSETLCSVLSLLGDKTKVGTISLTCEDLYRAMELVNESNYTKLPDGVKSALVNGLIKLRHSVADICYEYYENHNIEETDEIIELLRSIVKIHYEE